MRALILQHQDDAPAGLLLDALERAGARTHIVHLDRGEDLPAPDEFPLVASLGASASAADDGIAWVTEELAWLRHADAAAARILGLCFGAQILARALGGSVSRDLQPERGWITVSSRAPELLAPGPWLTWHDDAIHLPAGAEVIADNAAGVQAYRAGHHLGVQFHPEVTPQIVHEWVIDDAEQTVDGQTLLAETDVHFQEAAQAAARLFDAFVREAR